MQTIISIAIPQTPILSLFRCQIDITAVIKRLLARTILLVTKNNDLILVISPRPSVLA
jgi:hypothetical protein